MHFLALKEVVSLAGLMHAGQNFDQGGLARPVITEQAHHLPGSHAHRNVFERDDAAEVLRDILDIH